MGCNNPMSKLVIIPKGKWFKFLISNHSDSAEISTKTHQNIDPCEPEISPYCQDCRNFKPKPKPVCMVKIIKTQDMIQAASSFSNSNPNSIGSNFVKVTLLIFALLSSVVI